MSAKEGGDRRAPLRLLRVFSRLLSWWWVLAAVLGRRREGDMHQSW